MIADDVAAAVVTEINAQAWTETFTAEHVEIVEDLAPGDVTLHCRVYDATVGLSRAARRVLSADVTLAIAFEQQQLANDDARVKALKSQVEAVALHLAFNAIAYQLTAIEYAVHRDTATVEEDRAFRGIIRATYRNYAKPS